MFIVDKKRQLKDELIDKGKLTLFENTISAIVDKIYATPNCVLSCVDLDDVSLNEQSEEDGSHRSHIRIGLKDRKGDPITVIWDILHEYGHHLTGMPKQGDLKLKREELAWEKAYEEFQNYPELQSHKESLNDYRELCLNNYRANPDLLVLINIR
jgi:hypothetical protein